MKYYQVRTIRKAFKNLYNDKYGPRPGDPAFAAIAGDLVFFAQDSAFGASKVLATFDIGEAAEYISLAKELPATPDLLKLFIRGFGGMFLAEAGDLENDFNQNYLNGGAQIGGSGGLLFTGQA